MPHAALWVVQQRIKSCRNGTRRFQCRTRLFPFAPTTASRSPSPAHAGEAWLGSVFSQNHAISASPAGAGERSTSANHTSFYSCSWDVFPYDLFPVQLCPMGLLLGQVSKWRAQRADRGAHAARGFVGGAASESRVRAFETRTGFNAARGFVGGAAIIHYLYSRWRVCFNAARGFAGGAAMSEEAKTVINALFQCRTRLCGWCSHRSVQSRLLWRTRFNAARGFVGGATSPWGYPRRRLREFQCRTRLCGWCNCIARSPCPPRGKKPFWKVSENLSVLTENM